MSFEEIFPYIKLGYIIVKLIMTIVITILEAYVAKTCIKRATNLKDAIQFPFDLKLFDHACVLHMVGRYMWMLVISPWLFTSLFGLKRWMSQIHSVFVLWYFDKEMQKHHGFELKYRGAMVFEVFEREVMFPETYQVIEDGARTYEDLSGIMTFLRLYFTIWVVVRFFWFAAQYTHRFLFSNMPD